MLKYTSKRVVAITLTILLLWSTCFAEGIIEPSADFYYFDEVGILSEELKGEIYFSNKLLFDSCGAQIVVVVLNTINGVDIEKYCTELFNHWGIGDKKKNNGFLLLLTIEDEDYYACPGAGLKNEISSVEIKQMLDEYLENDFSIKNYEAGIKAFYEAIFTRIADLYHSSATTQEGLDNYLAYLDVQQFHLKDMSMESLLLLQRMVMEEIGNRMTEKQ